MYVYMLGIFEYLYYILLMFVNLIVFGKKYVFMN